MCSSDLPQALTVSNADNAWMLVSSALVLMMTGPGLALFYGGLVRKKNVLGTMMQSFAMMAVITVLWAIVGYSLAFGTGNGFIGGFHNAFLRGVGLRNTRARLEQLYGPRGQLLLRPLARGGAAALITVPARKAVAPAIPPVAEVAPS